MNLANWISIFRVLLIPFFVGSIIYCSPQKDYLRFLAVGIFLAAGISDVLDGYIARTRNMQTKLGSFLDPLADKLLLSASFIVLAFANSISFKIRLPIWVLILFISRDVILALGSLLVHLTTSNLKIEPSIWGKLTTFSQMATVIGILLQFSYSFLLWDVAAVITVASGLDYIYKSNRLLSAGK
ncbi:MAG: CDP-diacylglycerol--glycerol-3-phosphate 3-phosphatidyltransferase [Candidatus Omnitrophica bacterium]|nr:CDP-diacylglycerol--glycerol-3-phosphate 3-phosphatidyltransferase [Candidatus Omnitrophota bacterium]